MYALEQKLSAVRHLTAQQNRLLASLPLLQMASVWWGLVPGGNVRETGNYNNQSQAIQGHVIQQSMPVPMNPAHCVLLAL